MAIVLLIIKIIVIRVVTVHTPLSREVFWHEYAKIPRHASQNPIAEGDFSWILTRNCEGTEQLRKMNKYERSGQI